ncbi:MAG: CapA family protein, partial [Caldisericaceae bacterium]|nr:CapA family protein [Caldisericaceae bacterium]
MRCRFPDWNDIRDDLIIGAHPHVAQEIEEYVPKNSKTGRLIFYS